MNLAYLGDALDHWKGSLFQFLEAERLVRNFAVDPMATDGAQWTVDDFELFARLLRVTDPQILRHRFSLSARDKYFAEITHSGDLFLDPDTGIDTGSGSPVDKYVKPQEIGNLLKTPDGRVVAVYQHVRAQKTSIRVDVCLAALINFVDHTGWCSYESGNVAMLFLSRDITRTTAIANGFGHLLGRHAEGRVRAGTNRNAAQGAGADGTRAFR